MEREDNTLEQMKAQIAILKDKIANEEIVSDRMIRTAIKKDYSLIMRHTVIEVVCAVFVIVWALTYIPLCLELSWWFAGATVLFMLVCMGFTLWNTWNVSAHRVMTQDLASAAKQMKVIKRRYDRWLVYASPALMLWVGWFAYEVWRSSDDPKLAYVMLAGMGVGLLIGILIALRMRKRFIEACDDVIDQIERN